MTSFVPSDKASRPGSAWVTHATTLALNTLLAMAASQGTGGSAGSSCSSLNSMGTNLARRFACVIAFALGTFS